MELDRIKTRIADAAIAAGRKPGDITLIAVSKVQPPERVQAVLDAPRYAGDALAELALLHARLPRAAFGIVGATAQFHDALLEHHHLTLVLLQLLRYCTCNHL